MTGFGEAHRQQNGLAVAVELRTINSRYFKLSVRCPEGYGVLESEIEAVVRQQIRRGTVQVSMRVDRDRTADDYRLNVAVLNGYREQLEQLHKRWRLAEAVSVESLLALPGVVVEGTVSASDALDDWPLVRDTIQQALSSLSAMRSDEGRAMADDLEANRQVIREQLARIAERAPLVVDSYRARLTERLNKALAEYEISMDPADLIKEVSVYAERSDISEEIVRLGSHLDQFATIMAFEESSGRKLEFLTQEMFRETNTIGSKAGDVEIARSVIEIKTAIERIREMIQNVE